MGMALLLAYIPTHWVFLTFLFFIRVSYLQSGLVLNIYIRTLIFSISESHIPTIGMYETHKRLWIKENLSDKHIICLHKFAHSITALILHYITVDTSINCFTLISKYSIRSYRMFH